MITVITLLLYMVNVYKSREKKRKLDWSALGWWGKTWFWIWKEMATKLLYSIEQLRRPNYFYKMRQRASQSLVRIQIVTWWNHWKSPGVSC